MAFKLPWSNFHELNLDWILEKIKELREDVDNISGAATPYTSTPEMDGIGSAGSAVSYARGDHRHPTDTSRASAADLAQEILDRDGADLTLQANIDATDAKIKFSASAPLMDSSSASAGFSDFLARADHIHPTDTSRASATDLATLTARVDAFSGSASPYDSLPEMDGTASAGSVGDYARGNHVHPADTRKLDKAGGTVTGDLIVNGSLTAAKLETYTSVSSIGWLRVATIPKVDGTLVDIVVVRKGDTTPAETHKISLRLLQNSVSFIDESSLSDTLFIDKIRYSNAGKLDIHMDQAELSTIGVFIMPAAHSAEAKNNIETLPISGIADSPLGETILSEYTFNQNSSENYNYTVSTHGDTIGPASYLKREGDAIYGYLAVTTAALTGGTWCSLASMPNELAPASVINFLGLNNATSEGVQARIKTDGYIEIWPAANVTAGTFIYIPFTYIK